MRVLRPGTGGRDDSSHVTRRWPRIEEAAPVARAVSSPPVLPSWFAEYAFDLDVPALVVCIALLATD